MRSTRRNNPAPLVRGARRSTTIASNIGLISRGGPGSSTNAVRPCSSHSPGAVPFGFGSTVAPRGTIAWRRLISGIVHPAPLEPLTDAIDDRLVEVERNLKQPRDGRSRDVVLGRAEPAGDHDHVGPRQCRPQQLGELLDVVAGDQLEPHVDRRLR